MFLLCKFRSMFVLVQIPCGVGGEWALCSAVVFYAQVSAYFSFSDDSVPVLLSFLLVSPFCFAC